MNAAVIAFALWIDFLVLPGIVAGTIYGIVRAATAGKRNHRARVAQMNADAEQRFAEWRRQALGHRAH